MRSASSRCGGATLCIRLLPGIGASQFGLRADKRHRRSQFVRGICGKFCDPQKSRFDPVEHFIQRVGESLQFIASF